jgi:ankyrin repeat protein
MEFKMKPGDIANILDAPLEGNEMVKENFNAAYASIFESIEDLRYLAWPSILIDELLKVKGAASLKEFESFLGRSLSVIGRKNGTLLNEVDCHNFYYLAEMLAKTYKYKDNYLSGLAGIEDREGKIAEYITLRLRQINEKIYATKDNDDELNQEKTELGLSCMVEDDQWLKRKTEADEINKKITEFTSALEAHPEELQALQAKITTLNNQLLDLNRNAELIKQNKSVYWLIRNKRYDEARTLIAAGADFSTASNEIADLGALKLNNDNALTVSLKLGRKDLVAQMIAQAKELNSPERLNYKNKDGNTALSNVAFQGDREIVEQLIEAQADVNQKNNMGDTALIRAAFKGHKEIVKKLTEVRGVNLDIQGENGGTALYWAIKKGHYDVAKWLIAKGADFSIISNDTDSLDNLTLHKENPLTLAIKLGQIDLAMQIIAKAKELKKFECLNSKNSNGDTPLILASGNGNIELVQKLLAMGIDPNKKNNRGATALMPAAGKGDVVLVKKLLSFGVDPDIKDNRGITALSYRWYSAGDKRSERSEIENAIKFYKRNPFAYLLANNKLDSFPDFICSHSPGEIKKFIHYAMQQGRSDLIYQAIAKNADNTKLQNVLKDNSMVRDIIKFINKDEQNNKENNLYILHALRMVKNTAVPLKELSEATKRVELKIKALEHIRKEPNIARASTMGANILSKQEILDEQLVREWHSKNYKQVLELIENGAHLGKRGENGLTNFYDLADKYFTSKSAFTGSSDLKDKEFVETLSKIFHLALADSTIDINSRTPQGQNLLHNAASLGLLTEMKMLIDKGIDINARDKYGKTPKDYFKITEATMKEMLKRHKLYEIREVVKLLGMSQDEALKHEAQVTKWAVEVRGTEFGRKNLKAPMSKKQEEVQGLDDDERPAPKSDDVNKRYARDFNSLCDKIDKLIDGKSKKWLGKEDKLEELIETLEKLKDPQKPWVLMVERGARGHNHDKMIQLQKLDKIIHILETTHKLKLDDIKNEIDAIRTTYGIGRVGRDFYYGDVAKVCDALIKICDDTKFEREDEKEALKKPLDKIVVVNYGATKIGEANADLPAQQLKEIGVVIDKLMQIKPQPQGLIEVEKNFKEVCDTYKINEVSQGTSRTR